MGFGSTKSSTSKIIENRQKLIWIDRNINNDEN